MPCYESVFLARQDVSAQQVAAMTETFTNLVKEHGGEVPKNEYWGLRTLAYRIKKNRKAHYVLMNVEAPATALAELERNLKLNEDVIRYMSIRVDELEEGPSVMMRNKAARDERSRRDERPRGERFRDDRGGQEAKGGSKPSAEEGKGGNKPSAEEGKGEGEAS